MNEVKKDKNGNRPKQDAGLQGAVIKQYFFGRCATLFGVQNLQVAQNAIKHKGDGEHHAVGMFTASRREGVKHISDENRGKNDYQILAKQFHAIATQSFSRFA